MDQKGIGKFQVIGACVKMQTISLEDEIKLIDGIPYDIDFFQNFSNVYQTGHPIEDIPVEEIIDTLINSPNNEADAYIPTAEDYRKSEMLWEEFDEYCEKERREIRKWEKRKGKPKSIKEAEKNFNDIVDGLLKG